ncbi:hypothetical protein Ahy_A03g016167 isoform B [Arachis hypogaea]|uniref:NAD-dependent epimerase/dehydratase domain-containing protein n=2 Tax=Arachis hypogaea TaxID=3818 RepID=A0A445E2F5_ARAHY|nr:hypothetical protein Ahy_A03g016167 isoform B [Arachis hypogaea]
MSSGAQNKVVCVTGGSGYIASWIIKFLLQRDYTVRATVRDPSNPKKVEHLLKLEGAKERLQLFKADLLEEASFDSVVEGCHGVFHTASPVLFTVKDPQAELIDPAIKGTINVLESCAKSASVKRVVLTSSFATLIHNGKPKHPNVIVDETWFADLDYCKKQRKWYSFGKTSAENVARKFLSENNIDLVVINQAMTIGPLLQPELNASVSTILNLVNGSETFPNKTFGWINVKDVANAHIQAYEIASASGRYCLVERVSHFSEVAMILHDIYPTIKIPDKCADDKPYEPTFQVSKEKAKSLGIEFIPLEVSLKETDRRMERNGNGKVVCVTGGSGYIASWIVKLLLHRGYTVKTTLRDPSNPKKVEHLLKLDGAEERLQLFKADLLEEGSFDSAIRDCHGVFHVASPVLLDVQDPQKELIDPAVKGTINVLKSCAKTPSVKRVVLTSSMATNLYSGKNRTTPEDVVDETLFSLPDICRESQCSGTKTFPNLCYPWVNVKDVANFHILAYEVASATGRYCLAERVVHFSELANMLRNLYPTLQIANKCENDEPYVATYRVSEKAKNLGIRFTPLEVTLKETVESFRKNKIFNF